MHGLGIAGAIAAGALLTTALVSADVNPSAQERVAAALPTQNSQINRQNRTDALPQVANNTTPRRITTVEVVGVEDTAIVYRDRGHLTATFAATLAPLIERQLPRIN